MNTIAKTRNFTHNINMCKAICAAERHRQYARFVVLVFVTSTRAETRFYQRASEAITVVAFAERYRKEAIAFDMEAE